MKRLLDGGTFELCLEAAEPVAAIPDPHRDRRSDTRGVAPLLQCLIARPSGGRSVTLLRVAAGMVGH